MFACSALVARMVQCAEEIQQNQANAKTNTSPPDTTTPPPTAIATPAPSPAAIRTAEPALRRFPLRLDKVLQIYGGQSKQQAEAAVLGRRVVVRARVPPYPTAVASSTKTGGGSSGSVAVGWSKVTPPTEMETVNGASTATTAAIVSNPARLVFPRDDVVLDGVMLLPAKDGSGDASNDDAASKTSTVFALYKPTNMEVTTANNSKLKVWLSSLSLSQPTAAPPSPSSSSLLLQETTGNANGNDAASNNADSGSGNSKGVASNGSSAAAESNGSSAAAESNGSSAAAERDLMFVGRLDKRTTGLLLATSDGELCSLICTPGQCIKVYTATVRCRTAEEPTEAQMRAAVDGVVLNDGRAAAVRCTVINRTTKEFQPAGRRSGSTDRINGKGKGKGKGQGERKGKNAGEGCVADTATHLALAEGTTPPAMSTPPPPLPSQQQHTDFLATVEVAIATGKYRVVRRLLAAVGLPV